MSPEADVAFMESACVRIADARAMGASVKQKIGILVRLLQISENRAYEFYKGKARRVDGFEKDRAREVLAAIEAENARRKEQEHIEWLRSTYEQMAEGDSGVDSHEVVRLEHLLRKLGALDSPVEVPGSPQA